MISCVAIILAIDVSTSVKPADFRHMREGVAAALASPEIIEAAAGGDYRIAMFDWAQRQAMALDWTPINSEAELRAAAAAVLAAPRVSLGNNTATGEAMQYGVALGEATECADVRLNIISDGENNAGADPTIVRDGLTTWRTQINGVAIGDGGDFLRDRVIYGSGAFVEIADDFAGFREAMIRKLGREMQLSAVMP